MKLVRTKKTNQNINDELLKASDFEAGNRKS